MFIFHVDFFAGDVRYPLLRKSLYKLLEVLLNFFDRHFQRIGDVVDPLLLRQLLGRILILNLNQLIKRFRLLIWIRYHQR